MARFKDSTTGVTVSVADGKDLGVGWEPIDDETQKARASRRKKAEDKPVEG